MNKEDDGEDREDNKSSERKMSPKRVMEGEVLEFVKNKMSQDKFAEIRTTKGPGYGQPVQKSHHRNRTKQCGRGITYIGSEYSNFMRESIENQDELCEPGSEILN